MTSLVDLNCINKRVGFFITDNFYCEYNACVIKKLCSPVILNVFIICLKKFSENSYIIVVNRAILAQTV